MDLSSELISQFVKATKDETKQTSEATIYGTTVEYNGTMYVKLDGSERLTPVETTVALKSNERVTVLVKNHTATVTGNISSPAARNTDVEALTATVANFDTVIAEQIDAKTANIESAIITNLDGKYATFDAIKSAEGEIDILKADNVTINQKLTARDAEIDQLKANSLSVEVADAKYATIDNLTGTNAKLNNLESTYGEFVELTTNKFEAIEGTIADLDVESLNAKYANIDFSNIGKAAMENFYANSGLIQNVVVGDQTITGELVGVTISGDLIKANTLVADKLVIKGEDGLYYKLNAEGGATAAQLATEEYKNGLHGSNIIANSITADKIRTTDLVAIAAKIGNFNIGDNSIYSGAKSSVDNTTRGIYMDTNGQLNVGDSNNYLKFFKDQNGTYKLAIAAESLTFGVSGTKIEDAFDEVKDSVNNIQVGGRNLFSATDTFHNNNNYAVASYSPASEPLVEGETYTVSMCVTPAANVSHYAVYFSNGTSNVAELFTSGTHRQILTQTFVMRYYEGHHPANGAYYANCTIYRFPNDGSVTGNSMIHWLKIEKGTKATDWSPAPEEVASGITNAQNTANTANTAANMANSKADALSRSGSLWPDPSCSTSGVYEGWQSGGGDPHYGNYKVLNSRDNYSYHAIPLTPGHKYKISCAAYRNWGDQHLRMTFWIAIQTGNLEPYSLLGNIIETEGIPVTSAWTRLSSVVTIPEGVTFGYLYFQMEMWDNSTMYSVSDIHIEDVTEAYEAAKTATNFMNFNSTDGLVISEDASSTAGNVQIKSDGFRIRNGTTVNASFLGNTITLGQNSTSSYINLCGDKGQIKVTSKDKYGAGTVDALQIDSEDITIYGESSVSSLLRCQDVGDYATMGQAWLHLTSQTNTANNGTKYYTPSIRLGIHATVTNIASTTNYGTHNNFIEISPDLGTAMYSGTSMIRCRDSNYYGSSAEMFSYGMVKLAVYDSEINPYLEITPKTSDTTTTRIYMAARNINLDAIDMTTIDSPATVTGLLTANGGVLLPTNKNVQGRDPSGNNVGMMVMSSDNQVYLGQYGTHNTVLCGNHISFGVYSKQVFYYPYYKAGDSVSLTWSGAGFISSGGSKVYFSIPLSKPVIGNPTVTVSSIEGLTIRQNNAYLYGSSASVFVIASSYAPTLVGTDYVRVIATMPNTTNVTNNSSCGIYASIKITFS